MGNETAEFTVPVEKVTIHFTGTIVVDVALVDCEGRARTMEDAVRQVLGDIESEINEHLMYSDDSREDTDLVQAIHQLNIGETAQAEDGDVSQK
ncbi:hypothetical protein ABZ281_07595 [Streptomyces sp. NPDC006265]|uniref:hypothetical protein n=1 Tax=Streptomyces sp. NPDC006265 TaxID=3156740 RepID=UPI0033A48E77